MGRALLLTGRPGVGKTTVIRAVVAHLGARAGGFYTEEIRETGRRTGFRLVALDGPTGILASVNIPGSCRVGRYRVCLPDLEQVGVGSLWRAIRSPDVPVVVIDEIGKMELFSPAFRDAVLAGLDSSKTIVGTITTGRSSWVDKVKSRPEVTLREVTPENRGAFPALILNWLGEDWRDWTHDGETHPA